MPPLDAIAQGADVAFIRAQREKLYRNGQKNMASRREQPNFFQTKQVAISRTGNLFCFRRPLTFT